MSVVADVEGGFEEQVEEVLEEGGVGVARGGFVLLKDIVESEQPLAHLVGQTAAEAEQAYKLLIGRTDLVGTVSNGLWRRSGARTRWGSVPRAAEGSACNRRRTLPLLCPQTRTATSDSPALSAATRYHFAVLSIRALEEGN